MQKSMLKELEKNNSPYLFGDLVVKILNCKNPKMLYCIKNSAGQKVIGMMPEKIQDAIYFKTLSEKKPKEENDEKEN